MEHGNSIRSEYHLPVTGPIIIEVPKCLILQVEEGSFQCEEIRLMFLDSWYTAKTIRTGLGGSVVVFEVFSGKEEYKHPVTGQIVCTHKTIEFYTDILSMKGEKVGIGKIPNKSIL